MTTLSWKLLSSYVNTLLWKDGHRAPQRAAVSGARPPAAQTRCTGGRSFSPPSGSPQGRGWTDGQTDRQGTARGELPSSRTDDRGRESRPVRTTCPGAPGHSPRPPASPPRPVSPTCPGSHPCRSSWPPHMPGGPHPVLPWGVPARAPAEAVQRGRQSHMAGSAAECGRAFERGQVLLLVLSARLWWTGSPWGP